MTILTLLPLSMLLMVVTLAPPQSSVKRALFVTQGRSGF